MKIVRLIPATRLNLGAEQIFSYLVPDNLSDLQVGSIVQVPFGKRTLPAAVVAVNQERVETFPLKPIQRVLIPEPILTAQLLELSDRLSKKYLSPRSLFIKMMMPKPAPQAKILRPTNLVQNNRSLPHRLNAAQATAVKKISASLEQPAKFLLYGVTGSGKTEVYLRIIEKILRAGRQCLILVPEIALTPQTLARFSSRFPSEQVAVVHSKISYGQKYLIWKKILSNQIKILIGPRSALFAPFHSLGLIVIDEEHDSSYKQGDQQPKYHARTAAALLSDIWSCPVILGDATPSLETFYASELKTISRIELPQRIKQQLPKVTLVDMRQEAKSGNFSIFSELLLDKIGSTLNRSQSVILFINRRGLATSMQCQDCLAPILCDRCSVPVVYHSRLNKLVCHHCDKKFDPPLFCDNCGSHRLKLFGTGTEKVEQLIAEHFPQSRVLRFDKDTAKNKSDLERLYRAVSEKHFDILVGTQMLAKGWDLSHVGLIGVVNSDTTLSMPDFRSNERTFQLITQVAGRAGRGDFPGEAVFQSYSPDNFALQAAISHDYRRFFHQELPQRKEYHYPPFYDLIKCTIKGVSLQKLMREAEQAAKNLASLTIAGVEIIGPSPAFVAKIRGLFHIRVIIKLDVKVGGPKLPPELARALGGLGKKWDIDAEPDNLL
ncbi:MAG: primosomal protein N' [Candidatus Doudnabacteria bacterium]|nr:primosomal protein N' [Candidatus Doudnabacteria bacterium]